MVDIQLIVSKPLSFLLRCLLNVELHYDDSLVISRFPIYVMYHKGYMYVGRSLWGVIREFIIEFQDDKHLVG
jgi:hypothetical protein